MGDDQGANQDDRQLMSKAVHGSHNNEGKPDEEGHHDEEGKHDDARWG